MAESPEIAPRRVLRERQARWRKNEGGKRGYLPSERDKRETYSGVMRFTLGKESEDAEKKSPRRREVPFQDLKKE